MPAIEKFKKSMESLSVIPFPPVLMNINYFLFSLHLKLVESMQQVFVLCINDINGDLLDLFRTFYRIKEFDSKKSSLEDP